ncbi:cell adhesion molecule CEACAM16-like [Centroberyx affinis]|uniref:cell adhesion molecule CEACAM16-like n=1 Tax=Centroberyx affinis TaxID=166261 RepID=UPI003A5BD57F
MCVGDGILPPGPLSGAVGGKVKFNTTLSPPTKPFLSVSWTFKGVNIITSTSVNVTSPGHTNRITLDRATGALELRSLVLGDSGEYSVSIIQDGGQQTQGNTTLNVYEDISGASITGSDDVLIEGQSSTNLTCDATGSISTREWMKDGQPLQPSDRVTFFENNRMVSISPVNISDNGQYLCQLSNPFSFAEASYGLAVNYGPGAVTILGPATATVDTLVVLYCSARTFSPAAFTWFFNGLQKDVDEAGYVIEKASYSHSGNYTCRAFNDVIDKHATASYSMQIKGRLAQRDTGSQDRGQQGHQMTPTPTTSRAPGQRAPDAPDTPTTSDAPGQSK